MENSLLSPFILPDGQCDGPVLVTGAGGCIGAWVVAILSASNIAVIAADLSDNRHRLELVMGKDAAEQVRWATCDVTDYEAVLGLAKKHQIEAIIHLAGLQVPFCAAAPALGARVNVEGTINILQTAKDMGITRTAYASSVAALALPPGGPFKETLYGVYKMANEQSAFVYWADWQVPSIGLRPNVVYGVARDQGISSKNTLAIEAAVKKEPFIIPYTGNYSWLYAGEAAAAFIAAVSQRGEGASVFNLNGQCETIEAAIEIITSLAPDADIRCEGTPFPFPPDLDEAPVRFQLPEYPAISVTDGITATFNAFSALHETGIL